MTKKSLAMYTSPKAVNLIQPITREIASVTASQPGVGIAYISSYVPRKCGIATFCRDLKEGIEKADPTARHYIFALTEELSENLEYPAEVKLLIRQHQWADYKKAIRVINNSPEIDVVVLQHEYGLYGGENGDWILRFISQITKPVVTTFHTVTLNPAEGRRWVVQELGRMSHRGVVMLNAGVELLERIYGMSTANIRVIPHGVPEFKLPKHFFGKRYLNEDSSDDRRIYREGLKKKLGLEGKIVMTGINLLSSVKGVEFGVRSLPAIVKEVPSFVYQVVGETHPVFLKKIGGKDTYRQGLINLAKELGVEKNIKFVNKYVSVPELIDYINASDFYVTPYLDPQQATSGALAYAIGAGKVCVSTSYLYAKEMLGRTRGALVPFEDHAAISAAVLKYLKNPALMRQAEEGTFRIGRKMNWENVGRQYDLFFKDLLKASPQPELYSVPTA